MNKLSIITINLNNGNGLKKTIESIVCQSFDDFEYIVIDGGSTDGSVDIIKQYTAKITYWVSEPDKGIYNAMNKGIQKAKGDYCLFLNSGDCLVKDILSEIFSMDIKEDIVYGDLIEVDQDKIIRTVYYPDVLSMFFFYTNSLPHPSSFIKRQLFEYSLYDEAYKIVSDWYFFIKKIVYENCTYRHIHTTVSYYDIQGESSQNPVHFEERKSIMDLLLPKLVQDDYNTLLFFKNLKFHYLVNNYQNAKGLKKIVAYCLIKAIILYHIVFNKQKLG